MDNMNSTVEKSMEDIELEREVDRLEEMRRVRFKKRTLRNFAIIFFVALIILTFFSNTIMNYSLPEVTTETVYNGSVSQKVRCQGAVEVSLDQDVTVSGKRVVKEVFFEDGDTVKEGDVIMTFEEEENTDLKDAEEELEQLESDYEKQTLRVGPDYSEQLSAINAASDEVTVAETAVEQAKADEASLATARAELETAQAAYDAKLEEVAPLREKAEAIKQKEITGDSDYTDEDKTFLYDEYSPLEGELEVLAQTLEEKKEVVTSLEAKPTVADAEADLATKKATLESLQLSLVSKKKEDGVTAQTNAIDDANAEKKIDKQKDKIDKLKDTDDYKELKATGTGIISGLTYKPGDTIDAETQVASIQLADSGYVVTCTIPKKDSQVLRVGNEAEIENLWGDDVSASIRSIKADPSNPNQQSIVKFEVKGNVQVGETLQFAVGNKTGKYDTVIPNGAVKEDSGGKFVYVVKVRATPLGNRYITKKVNVDVLASDTANSAISGDVSELDNVIINSSKPLDDGQQVRLTDK